VKIKVSSGKAKDLEQVINMPDGPKKKFWLLAAIAQVSGPDASVAARRLSCEEIIHKCGFG
jgi:hypothetical protein